MFTILLLCGCGFACILAGYFTGIKAIQNKEFDLVVFGLLFILFGLGVIIGSVLYWCG